MAIPVIMPKQGQSVETCIITSWLKKKGEHVKTGDLIFSYETDKAAFDMESPADGILLDIFFGDGDEVPVLTNVAVIGQSGENIDSFRPAAGAGNNEKKVPDTHDGKIAEIGKDSINQSLQPDGRIKISPRAKKLAEEKGIDISLLAGTGPGGRIVVGDIEAMASGYRLPVTGDMPGVPASLIPAAEFTDKPLTNVRKLISKAMHSSLKNSAQLTHHMSADVRKLLETRKKIKEAMASGSNVQDITLNDMICLCVIKALKKFPAMNSHFLDDRIRTFSGVNLGIAVDTPRGLMVPSVINADGMSPVGLSKALKALAESCRKGNVDPELLRPDAASFTVSNLGSYGVEMFTPVINLPQCGILGVCTITHRPADLGNGIFGFIPVIGLSLTYDHRAVDGGPATLFLRKIKNNIENFEFKPE